MVSYSSYDEEMSHLRNLPDTVIPAEYSIEEDNEFSDKEEQVNEDYYSDHDSSTEIEPHLESHVSDSNINVCFIESVNTRKWNKEKFRANVRHSAKNVIWNLLGTLYLCFCRRLVDDTNVFN